LTLDVSKMLYGVRILSMKTPSIRQLFRSLECHERLPN